MTRALASLLLAVALAGCGSAPKHGPERPVVSVEQINPIFFGSGYSAPVHIDVHVENVHSRPITLRTVRLEPGAGMGFFTIRAEQREFNVEIAPGSVKTVQLVPTAYTNIARHTPNEPFSVRAVVDVVVDGKRHRQMYIFRDISRQ
jgi:hypothetical protein